MPSDSHSDPLKNVNTSPSRPTTDHRVTDFHAEYLEETIEEYPDDEGEYEEDFAHKSITQTSNTVKLIDPIHRNLIWTGHLKQTPVVVFSANSVYGSRDPTLVCLGHRYHLTYKMLRNECKLMKSMFESHGFREASPLNNDFNIMWTGSHLKPYLLRSLSAYQRINHFPRSYELTRKDRLFKNIQRLQHVKGFKHFDFVPHSYVMPHEYQEFCSAFLSDKGPYIVKPIASSRGRGIYLISHPDQIPDNDHVIISKYINKPYLIDGFKFDIRLYVSVTSYDPLVIYLYEEGLVRFATVPYQEDHRFLENQCMHLTNYSINKKNEQFVHNDDADIEDFGNKWSLGALLRYLRCEGRDVTALMLRLEDVIIKAIVSVELPVSTACKMFQPHRGICFELYGFDIILDETLRPWLLEVNLSPSLNCDSPLDLKIKTHMISHLLNLIGVVCCDPCTLQSPQHDGRDSQNRKKSNLSSGSTPRLRRNRGNRTSNRSGGPHLPPCGPSLTADDIRMVRRVKEESQRRGGWLRIFPTKYSWDNYASFLQSNNPSNLTVHQKLFPGLWSERERPRGMPLGLTNLAGGGKSKIPLHSLNQDALIEENMAPDYAGDHGRLVSGNKSSTQPSTLPSEVTKRIHLSYECVRSRLSCYERKLHTPSGLRRSRSFPSNRRSRDSQGQRHEKGSSVASKELFKTQSCGDVRVKVLGDAGDTFVETAPSSSEKQGDTSSIAEVSTRAADDGVDPPDDFNSCTSDVSSLQTSKCQGTNEESIDWDDYSVLIDHGGQMTKFQARHTFTAYLSSVQRRLLEESQDHSSLTAEEEAVATEQIDLVVKFLRRASNHMHQPYKVHVPSRRLPIPQRKRVLSNVLNDFIHVYAKETITQRPRMRATETNHGVNNRALISFLTNSTEKELEQMLATYTHMNKSAGIFIDASVQEDTEGTNKEAFDAAALIATEVRNTSNSKSKKRPSSGRRSRQLQRPTTPQSSRSRSSSARTCQRSRSASASGRSDTTSATGRTSSSSRSARRIRSRSAESPRNPPTLQRSRTASVGPPSPSAFSAGLRKRSISDRSRIQRSTGGPSLDSSLTIRPPAIPSGNRRLNTTIETYRRRRSGRRRPMTCVDVDHVTLTYRSRNSTSTDRLSGSLLSNSLAEESVEEPMRQSRRMTNNHLQKRHATTYAIYSRPPTASRVSVYDRQDTSLSIGNGRRLPSADPLVTSRRGALYKQNRNRLLENVYDKITYDAATGLSRLRQITANGRNRQWK